MKKINLGTGFFASLRQETFYIYHEPCSEFGNNGRGAVQSILADTTAVSDIRVRLTNPSNLAYLGCSCCCTPLPQQVLEKVEFLRKSNAAKSR